MGPLAVMLYKALDYRLEDSEERELAPSLSSLIEVMLEMENQTPSISELVYLRYTIIFPDARTNELVI